MTTTAAAFMAETLRRAGVKRVYGVVGDSLNYFQATHPEILFKECSHYVELVSRPEQLPQILHRAMRVAVAKRGVAVAVVPGDVALKPLSAQQGLRAALSEALAHDGPVLVDVVSARQELAMPPKTRLDDAQHFGMFLIKAVLDGRGTQLIDLARTNLIR